jgi:hypothetical protein
MRLYAVLLQVALGQAHILGRDALALQVVDALERRVVVDGNHHADRVARVFGVLQLQHLAHIGVAVLHPVVACDARVEDAVLHIERDFLRAQQDRVQFGIVRDGFVGAPRRDTEVPACLAEQREGRLLQASFGQPQPQLARVAHRGKYTCSAIPPEMGILIVRGRCKWQRMGFTLQK